MCSGGELAKARAYFVCVCDWLKGRWWFGWLQRRAFQLPSPSVCSSVERLQGSTEVKPQRELLWYTWLFTQEYNLSNRTPVPYVKRRVHPVVITTTVVSITHSQAWIHCASNSVLCLKPNKKSSYTQTTRIQAENRENVNHLPSFVHTRITHGILCMVVIMPFLPFIQTSRNR